MKLKTYLLAILVLWSYNIYSQTNTSDKELITDVADKAK